MSMSIVGVRAFRIPTTALVTPVSAFPIHSWAAGGPGEGEGTSSTASTILVASILSHTRPFGPAQSVNLPHPRPPPPPEALLFRYVPSTYRRTCPLTMGRPRCSLGSLPTCFVAPHYTGLS